MESALGSGVGRVCSNKIKKNDEYNYFIDGVNSQFGILENNAKQEISELFQ